MLWAGAQEGELLIGQMHVSQEAIVQVACLRSLYAYPVKYY